MTEKEYVVTFRCLGPLPSPRKRGREEKVNVNATSKEEAKERAKPTIQEKCKTEDPKRYQIISVHTRQDYELIRKLKQQETQ